MWPRPSGVALDRGLVDDVLLTAWMILRRHGEKVLGAARPWACLLSSAQTQVMDKVRAQQLLTRPSRWLRLTGSPTCSPPSEQPIRHLCGERSTSSRVCTVIPLT